MRNRLGVLVLVLALVPSVLGHPASASTSEVLTSSWPQYRFDSAHTSYNPDEVVMNARAVRRARPISTIRFDRRVSWILADEGDLFVPWGPAFEGADPWAASLSRYGMDGAEISSIAGSNDAFALADGHLALQAADPGSGCASLSVRTTGAPTVVLWEGAEGMAAIDTTTVFTNDQVLSDESGLCHPENVHARDVSTGEERWASTGTDVVVEGGVAYVGSHEGQLLALDEATGAERWRWTRPGGWVVPLASSDGTLYVWRWRPGGAALVALDEADHRVEWRRHLRDGFFFDGFHGLSVGDGHLVVAGGHAVVALRPVDGSVLWRRSFDRRVFFDVRGAAGVVYAWAYRDRWIALRSRDGTVLRTFAAEDLIVAGGTVVTKLGNDVTIWGPPSD